MSFDTEIENVLRREGGYANDPDDRGGKTNFGISSKANPDIDVENLTREQAVEIYKKRYWDKAQVESFPANMQAAVFDAAVQHGPETARQMAKRSGGDLSKFNGERAAIYRDLLRDPSQQKFKKGWANRLAEFGAQVAVGGHAAAGDAWDSAAVARPVSADEAWNGSAQQVRAETDALKSLSARSTPNPLGRAAVDYMAMLKAAGGGDTASVYDHYRGQEAAAAEQLVNAGAAVKGGSGISDDFLEQQAAEQEALDKEQQFASLRDQFSYIWRENSATGALVDYFDAKEDFDYTPDPGLKYIDHMDEWEKGRNMDEIHELRSIGVGRFNKAMIEDTLRKQDRDRERAGVMRGAGALKTLGLSLVAGTAGDPLGMLAGFGTYKGFSALGAGSRAALVAGNTGRAFVYGGAEAAVGNVAITGVMDALGKQQSAGDYVMASAFGFALGAPFVALDIKGARIEGAKAELNRIMNLNADAAAERVMHFNDLARDELGPNASAEQVAARAQEMDLSEVRARMEVVLADLPDEDMLMPRPERMSGEEIAARHAADEAAEGESADAAAGDFYRRREGANSWMESKELRSGIEAAEQSGRASDVLRAVANDTGSSPPLRALAEKLTAIADDTGLAYVPNSKLSGQSATWAGAYFRDQHQMSIKVAKPDFIVHEALHGATSNIIATPKAQLSPELRAKVTRIEEALESTRLHYGMTGDFGGNSSLKLILDHKLGPLSNTQEFVTYAMTDTGFQQWLASIPAPPKSGVANAWEWFKTMVSDLLGLDGSERTALDEAIEASGDLVDAVSADTTAATRLIADEAERTVARMAKTQDAAAAPRHPTARPPGSLLRTRAQVAAMAKKYGLDAGISDPVERAVAAEMYARAERILAKNPIDEAKLKPLLSKIGWEATSTRMLLSKNPLMRATAVMLMENPEGAAGRRHSAALTKHLRERAYRAAVEPEYESLLQTWAAAQGKGKMRALVDPSVKRQFDKEVSREMNAQWMGQGKTTDNAAVLRMTEVLNRGFTMMGVDQQQVNSIGSARLPVGKDGYYPRVVKGDYVVAMTNEQRRIAVSALSNEMQVTAGFDMEFADKLAIKYWERAVEKTTGSWMVTLDLRSADTADVLRDSLQAMNFGDDEIDRLLGKFSRGGAKHTKSRIDLDLNAEHQLEDGSTFRLSDMFETDMLSLYKNYARRVSGEVSVTQFGIMGSPGMKELRKAISSTGSEFRVTADELDSFDQFASEMLGNPFGTRINGADTARAVVSAAYLGGMGFTQLAESTNGLHAVGAGGVLKSIVSMPRLYREVRAIQRGENVDGILSSVEVFNGAIGSDQYRLLGLRDVGDRPEIYGADKLGWFSLASRGANHAVRVLSMQRAIEAVQVRGMSEQIVRKAMRYIRNGQEDAALLDMGITPELRAILARNMDRIAQFQGDELVSLDLFQMDDALAARAFAGVVDRGASQIIQRTYIGETGKWAHHDHLLLLTQFRSYPLVATQKQWRRVAFSQGAAKAAGYILGAQSIIIPIYMARMALQSVGKEDGWLEERLTPMEIGRASARYTSGLGLTGDVLDAAAPVLGIESQSGRSAVTGTVPVVSYINSLGRAAAEKDPSLIWRALPGSNIPGVQAAQQAIFSEE